MLTDASTNTVIVHHLVHADTFWRRLRGLMFRSRSLDGEALLLSPCQSVHTCFMRFPIDVIFTGEGGEIVSIYAEMRPFRITRFYPQASHVLELPSGTVARLGLEVGGRLTW